jgi:hypothetical protein
MTISASPLFFGFRFYFIRDQIISYTFSGSENNVSERNTWKYAIGRDILNDYL